MAAPSPRYREVENGLALAIVYSSPAPLLLLDGDLFVTAVSASFCETFGLDPAAVTGLRLLDVGQGEWNASALWLLMDAVLTGTVDTETHEMDLRRPGLPPRRLVIEARRLAHGGPDVRLLLSACDVTESRIGHSLKDDLLREKTVLLQELQHRIANSLQIIASLLLHSARTVVSDETRGHLQDAHSRVMSVAALQQHLAASRLGAVELRAYFSDLCVSIGKAMIRDPDRLAIEVAVDDSMAPANVSVSLGLVVTELVINALKHAFPGQRGGRIVVRYAARGAGWILSVGDDGAGFSSEPTGVSTGLGTSIVEALSKRLGARVEIAHPEPGTLVSIICEAPTHAH